MAQNRHKQFEHEGKKLWAVFVTAKSPEVQSFGIQDETLRLPTVAESESFAKQTYVPLGALPPSFTRDTSATVAMVFMPPQAWFRFFWQDINNISLDILAGIRQANIKELVPKGSCPQLILIRKTTD